MLQDQTSASATLSGNDLDNAADKTTVSVDKTVTVATRTIVGVTKGTTTILTIRRCT